MKKRVPESTAPTVHRTPGTSQFTSHLQRGIDPSPFEGFIPPFGRLDLDQYDNGADGTARHDCRPLPRQSLCPHYHTPRLSVHEVGTRICCEMLKGSPIPNPNPKPRAQTPNPKPEPKPKPEALTDPTGSARLSAWARKGHLPGAREG